MFVCYASSHCIAKHCKVLLVMYLICKPKIQRDKHNYAPSKSVLQYKPTTMLSICSIIIIIIINNLFSFFFTFCHVRCFLCDYFENWLFHKACWPVPLGDWNTKQPLTYFFKQQLKVTSLSFI